MLTAALLRQKERIQAADASLAEGDRQRKEQEALSREVQARPSLEEKTERVMEKIRSQAAARVVADTEPEVPQEICRSFAIHAF